MIACVLVPHFAAAVERRANPALEDVPLLIGEPPGRPERVLAVSPEVTRTGVRPGMPLKQARLLCPQARLLPARPARYAGAYTELLDMLAHKSIKRILVVNAAQQGETIEDVVGAWRGAEAQGVILSKLDEAVKLAPALDTVIRHKLRVLGVTNGQRVPEDWHRLSSQALVQRALRSHGQSAWRMDASDVNLIFTAGSVGASTGAASPMGLN